ncbi:hypothetical protein MLD38_037623 [Melastoma candidum]|uniref:Uncharacterized protein n=1 Tax=Melastoma candidum TaxID=119954 RepID=A0ACB9LNY6_9MYRT|nr:hypothetical protein MLD38_037623 [Melastoma candidum]
MIIVLIVVFFTGNVETAFDATLMSRICNGKIFSFFDDRFGVPSDILDLVIAKTVGVPGSVVNTKISHSGTLYGAAYCSRSLTLLDCSGCLGSAKSLLFETCSAHGEGAQVHLKDCDLRYEAYPISDVR